MYVHISDISWKIDVKKFVFSIFGSHPPTAKGCRGGPPSRSIATCQCCGPRLGQFHKTWSFEDFSVWHHFFIDSCGLFLKRMKAYFKMINNILKAVCEQLLLGFQESRVPVRRFSRCQAPRWLPLLRLLMWGFQVLWRHVTGRWIWWHVTIQVQDWWCHFVKSELEGV